MIEICLQFNQIKKINPNRFIVNIDHNYNCTKKFMKSGKKVI